MEIKLARLNEEGKLTSIPATLPDGAELFDGKKCLMMRYNGQALSLQQWIDKGIIRVKEA